MKTVLISTNSRAGPKPKARSSLVYCQFLKAHTPRIPHSNPPHLAEHTRPADRPAKRARPQLSRAARAPPGRSVPRLFLLSDAELLSLLARPRAPAALGAIVTALFPGAARLCMSSPAAGTGSAAPDAAAAGIDIAGVRLAPPRRRAPSVQAAAGLTPRHPTAARKGWSRRRESSWGWDRTCGHVGSSSSGSASSTAASRTRCARSAARQRWTSRVLLQPRSLCVTRRSPRSLRRRRDQHRLSLLLRCARGSAPSTSLAWRAPPPPARNGLAVRTRRLSGAVTGQVAACARVEGALAAVAEGGTRLAGVPVGRDGAAPSVLAELEAAQEAEIAALVEALRGGQGAPLGALGRRKLCAAARLGVEARAAVQALRAAGAAGPGDFSWQGRVRHAWALPPAATSAAAARHAPLACSVHVLDAAGAYGYEYQGAAAGEGLGWAGGGWGGGGGRGAMALHSVLARGGCAALFGGAEAFGRAALTAGLARTLGRMVLRVAPEGAAGAPGLAAVRRVLRGGAGCGAWVCFEGLEAAPPAAVAAVAHMLRALLHAQRAGAAELALDGRPTALDARFALVLLSAARADAPAVWEAGGGRAARLPRALAALMRPVAVPRVDLAAEVEATLLAAGCAEARALARAAAALAAAAEARGLPTHACGARAVLAAATRTAAALRLSQGPAPVLIGHASSRPQY